MEEGFPFYFTATSSLLSLLGILLFLLDVALDLWTIVSMYQEGQYVYMGVLIGLLATSSFLVNIYSWIWYSEPNRESVTSTDKFVSRYGLTGPLHLLQLGILLRMASLVEISIRRLFQKVDRREEGVAAFLKYDLSTLRLFETFTESVPQLVLMITIVMQEKELQPYTVLKIAGSLISISISVLFYHKDMREFLPEEENMGSSSSVVFFLWNLFLIAPRVIVVALFASFLPCYLAAHFLCQWILLFLWAWRQKTDFMENESGEWLYRAMVGLIWYFSWFTVTSGKTKVKSIIYHVFMGADMVLLLVLWFWKRSVESASLSPLPINPYVLIGTLPALYIMGLLLKLLYYWRFHPSNPRLSFEAEDKVLQVVIHGVVPERNDSDFFAAGFFKSMVEDAAPGSSNSDLVETDSHESTESVGEPSASSVMFPKPWSKKKMSLRKDSQPEFRPGPPPEFRPKPQPEFKPGPPPEFRPEPQPEFRPGPQIEFRPEPQPEFRPGPQTEFRPEPQLDIRPEPQPEIRPGPQPEIRPGPQAEIRLGPQPEIRTGPPVTRVNKRMRNMAMNFYS